MSDETTTPPQPGPFQRLVQRGFRDQQIACWGIDLSRRLERLRNHPKQVEIMISEGHVAIDGFALEEPVDGVPGPIFTELHAILLKRLPEQLADAKKQAIARLSEEEVTDFDARLSGLRNLAAQRHQSVTESKECLKALEAAYAWAAENSPGLLAILEGYSSDSTSESDGLGGPSSSL